MADGDPDWLPKPPPPRPSAREDAIHAAMRKFDGEEVAGDRPKPTAARPAWRRPQFAAAFSAMLLVVVGVPAALIGVRSQDSQPERAPPAARFAPAAEEAADIRQEPKPQATQAPGPEAASQTAETRAAPAEERAPALEFATNDQPAGQDVAEIAAALAPAPPPAAAPPPPPPPPPRPPPPPPGASADVAAEASQDIVVTGSVQQRSNRAERARGEARATAKTVRDAQNYRPFLGTLQRAVRAGDRNAIIELIAFPLRVNYKSGARTYRDARAVERDFDRIFTPQVRRAVVNQSPTQIFSRDIGAMVGDGELWFDHVAPGQVKIIAVNP